MNQQNNEEAQVVNVDEINNVTAGTKENALRPNNNITNTSEINDNNVDKYSANSNVVEIADPTSKVLNYNEVEEVAMYEAKANKKPIILLTIAGIFSITMGLIYPTIMNFVDGENVNSNISSVSQDNTSDEVSSIELNCSVTSNGASDGTDSNTAISFYFINSKLSKYTKTLHMIPTTGNEQGTLNVTNYYNLFKKLEGSTINGYEIKSDIVDTGFNSTLTVDFSKFDVNTLTPEHISNSFTNVNYTKNENYDSVKEKVTFAGYLCDK